MTDAPTFDAPELDDEVIEQQEQIVTEAKKSFKLSDRIRGISQRREKVVIFTDPAAADRKAAIDAKLQALNDQIAKVTDPQHETVLREQYDALEEKLEEAKEEFYSSLIVLHLRSIPQVVTKSVRRKAKQAYQLGDGTIPGEKAEDFADLINQLLLSAMLEKAVTVDGPLEIEPDMGKMIHELISPAQWERVEQRMNMLAFSDAIGRAATDDPGF